jgi:integrase
VTIRTGEIDEPTKNQRSRSLGLDKATIEVLKANRRQQIEQQEQLGELYEDSGLVFTDELGRPLNLRSVSQWFDRLLTRYEAIRRAPKRPRGRGRPRTPEALASAYGMPLRAVELALTGPPLPPIRLQDLRHGAASLTYRATRDLKLVSELLGHSGIQITADTSTTLFQDVDTAAAEAVAALVPRRGRDVRTTCAPENKPDTGIPQPAAGLGLGGL